MTNAMNACSIALLGFEIRGFRSRVLYVPYASKATGTARAQRMYMMTRRIAATYILLAMLIAAPTETFARGGGFAGGRAVSIQRGFRAPIGRPPAIALTRPAAPAAIGHLSGRLHTKPFARAVHRRGPAVVFVGAPWYDDYYDGTSYITPEEPVPSDAGSSAESEATPPRLGCRAQSYKVPSEQGGTRTVKVVRC